MAEIFDAAGFTEGFAGVTHGAAVEDNAVAELRRCFRRENFAQFSFYFFRLFKIIYKTKTVGKANAMGVYHRAAGNMEDVTENQVCRLAADTRERNQIFHGRGNLSVKFFQQDFGTFNNVSRFGTKESAGMDVLLDFAYIRFRKGLKRREAGKECRGYLVNPLVGALSCETD